VKLVRLLSNITIGQNDKTDLRTRKREAEAKRYSHSYFIRSIILSVSLVLAGSSTLRYVRLAQGARLEVSFSGAGRRKI
jgi:uncharacterized membrane protein